MMDTEIFRKEVYEIVASIPCGKVLSYGEVAALAGYPGYHRLAGRVLRDAEKLPCHRVVDCRGRLKPGWSEQRELLRSEGVTFRFDGCVDMKRHDWRPMDNECF